MMTIAGAGERSARQSGHADAWEGGRHRDSGYNNINYQPINNVCGAIVTMIDTRAVRAVMGIAKRFVYWHGTLDGLGRGEADPTGRRVARPRARPINGFATGTNPDVINEEEQRRPKVTKPAFLTSCCYNGQNERAPHYALRP